MQDAFATVKVVGMADKIKIINKITNAAKYIKATTHFLDDNHEWTNRNKSQLGESLHYRVELS